MEVEVGVGIGVSSRHGPPLLKIDKFQGSRAKSLFPRERPKNLKTEENRRNHGKAAENAKGPEGKQEIGQKTYARTTSTVQNRAEPCRTVQNRGEEPCRTVQNRAEPCRTVEGNGKPKLEARRAKKCIEVIRNTASQRKMLKKCFRWNLVVPVKFKFFF